MRRFSGTGRWRIFIRSGRLLLLAVLVVVLFLPQSVRAQERQLDLIMRLVSHYYRVDVTAGRDNNFFLELNNIGNRPITGIKLSSEQPEGWIIVFNPDIIDQLNAGSIQTVDVNIKPPGSAGRGEHEINFIAEADELRKVEKFWITVKSPLWLWVGIGAVLLLVIVFILIYLRFGRQKSQTL
ncbi:MAG: NEW3 domain-containing protein [Dehalococcoidales bacterium]|nr:NEW3 domain-containing protein [Dehalococcoidales bacterium]